MIISSSLNISSPMSISSLTRLITISQVATNASLYLATPNNISMIGSHVITTKEENNEGQKPTPFSPIIEANSFPALIERLDEGEHEVVTAISTVSKQLKILKRNENEIGNLREAEKNVTLSTASNIIMRNQNELSSSNITDKNQSQTSIYNMTSHTHGSKYTALSTTLPKLVRNNSGLVCHDPTEFFKEKSYGNYYRINSSWNGDVQECYEYCGPGFNNFQECLCSPLMKTKAYTDLAEFFSIFFAIVGFIFNGFVLAALKNVVKDDVSSLNIICLASSDLLKCIIYLPVNHFRYRDRDWKMRSTDEFMCQFYAYIANTQAMRSVLCILLITISKWWIMFFPPTVSGHRRRNYLIAIACVWVFPFICLLPTLFGLWGQLGLECSSRGCNVIDDEYGNNPKNILVGVGTILPVVILIVADVSIFWKMKELSVGVKRASRAYSMKSVSSHDFEDVADNEYDAAVKDGLVDVLRRQETESIKMMVYIFLGFVCCFLPTLLLIALDTEKKEHPHFTIIAKIAYWATPVINPLIYIYSRTRYRIALFKVLSKFKVIRCSSMFGTSKPSDQLTWN